MPATPERSRAKTTTEELELTAKAGAPAAGHTRYDGSSFSMTDGAGSFDPRTGGAASPTVKVSADDTVAGYLEDKVESTDGSVGIATSNPGAAEKLDLTVSLDETFAAQEIETAVFASTSGVTWLNAWAGEPDEFIEIARDGLYYVQFISQTRMTNANAVGEIAIGLNSLVPITTSVAQRQGVTWNTTVAMKRIDCVIGDKLYGMYRKAVGPGSIELESRSLLVLRIGD